MDARTAAPSGVVTHNWFGDIKSTPATIVRPQTIEDIVAVMKNPERYPSPVRAAGSTHSTTRCVVADGGTVLDMKGMNRILDIGPDTVTTEAGALYIDVAKALQGHNLQFHVNIELGNLTMGSAACTHTKDAAFDGEFGIVSSYAVGMKVVLPTGEILEVTEEQPELLQAMRTSFGLLGVLVEVTFRVKPLRHLAVYHEVFSMDEFERQLPALRERRESMMYYLFPFQDRIAVEFRRSVDPGGPMRSGVWRVRNLSWGTIVPGIASVVRRYVPGRAARYGIHEAIATASLWMLKTVRTEHSYPVDQMIRYPEKAGWSRYTFSIWAFPEERFVQTARDYYAFCRDYYRTTGYRCDMLNVGYRIHQDRSSLFSYTWDGTAMTIDPVSTAGAGWPEFLEAYNDFCSLKGGSPLLNQSAYITAAQVQKAFGERIERFRQIQRQYDPSGRLVNAFFADLLGLTAPQGGER